MAQTRERALSHKEYLDTLHAPDTTERLRIASIQEQREIEIGRKYSSEAGPAATKIQQAYRGYRARRELQGLTLDPASRWTELIRELRYRGATVPHHGPRSPGLDREKRRRAPSDVAKMNWRRVGQIAEHAGGGTPEAVKRGSSDYFNTNAGANPSDQVAEEEEAAESLLMDARYFLEMVDNSHRYGSNLQIYHEEWLRTGENHNFFYWLDFGEGRHLDLPGCSRTKLDKEKIRYLSKEERMAYLADVDEEGLLRWHRNNELITTNAKLYRDSLLGVVPVEDTQAPTFDDEDVARQRSEDRQFYEDILLPQSPDSASSISSSDSSQLPATSTAGKAAARVRKKKHLVSPATILNRLLRASVKPGTFIYVADTLGRLYVGIKSSGAFQHASFLSGSRISSAGSISIENGHLTYLSPLSGHYRPTTKSFKAFISSLKKQNVDLSQLRVSHAFEVLETMEIYGKTKKGAKTVLKGTKHDAHHDPKPRSLEPETRAEIPADDQATTDRGDKKKRRSLLRMMEEFKLARKRGGSKGQSS